MATQRSLLEELKLFHHNALTGPVALDLNFHVTTDQPPALYNLAKYLLDVLGPTHFEGQGRERRHVLYRDDRQVKLLYVHLSHPSISDATVKTVDDGHTWLTARPLRDVLEDIRLVDELEAATMAFRGGTTMTTAHRFTGLISQTSTSARCSTWIKQHLMKKLNGGRT